MYLGVLCSGNLGYEMLINLHDKYLINFVATDKNSSSIIKYCHEKEIYLFIGNPRYGKLKNFVGKIDCDVIISINYLFLIEKDVIDIPRKLAFNVHGSILPKYRGRTPHVWAIINGEKECGITAHVIDEGCDSGDILEQISIPIYKNDTGASLLAKFNKNYPPLIFQVLNNLEQGNIITKKQNEEKATYFGKRSPDHGKINWDWSKERIFDWVRAQNLPYPGAFTYLGNEKVIIDWVEIVDYGFHYLQPNGLVVKLDNDIPFVKVSNGILTLNKIRNLPKIEVKKNDIFK